jgi:DEAD/DEAH box helicase/Domain of unknown function (DUF1998)/Helicase conserved C-terminal domain
MSAPDGFALAEDLKQTFLSYLTSALPIGNHHSQQKLGQEFFEQWNRELFAGPFVEALPPYDKIGSLDDYFGDVRDRQNPDYVFASNMDSGITWADIDHSYPQFRKIRDAIWSPRSDEAEEEELENTASRLWRRPLYAHQWQSFEAVSRNKHNLIVATATGSGKTECYLIPLLYHLLTEAADIRRTCGVRALLLYPMNALVEDQMHRLRQLLFWVNLSGLQSRRLARHVTFGRYIGTTPIDAADRDPQRHVSQEALQGLGELVYRSEMQQGPPDILVTNFTMLEYILLRNDDQRLFARPELFNFLVLDEVHTYTGTQGMEVALLLRRLRAFLQMRSGKQANFIAVGTSATLPSAKEARARTAEFASALFGTPFAENDVIRPEIEIPPPATCFGDAEQAACRDALLTFREKFPALSCHLGVSEGDPTDVPEEEWELLARHFNPQYVPTTLSEDARSRVWYRLSDILKESQIISALRHVLMRDEPACLTLAELATNLFGHEQHTERATATLLKVVGAAHDANVPLLSLRFHMFVEEPSSAQVCLLPSCRDGKWWSRVYLRHHTKCDECSSLVYPLVLCRRCGFAYFEGWRRRFPSGGVGSDLYPEPDDADDEATYTRTLFRPLSSSIPDEAVRMSERRSLCLACGRWMVAEGEPYFDTAANHGCPTAARIQVCSWEPRLKQGVLEECVFCEQHWIGGQDVATPPAPSVYATATVLVEELERRIEQNGVSPFESKLISFSDSRQQAAQLAYRFQKTNREFTFRQLIWGIVSGRDEGISTPDLIDELYSIAKDDHRTRRLLIDNEGRLSDRALLQRTITSLLYRECVTAYLTLEAQGLVRLIVDEKLVEGIKPIFAAEKMLFARLTESEQKAFIQFLLDWNMRFRFAIAAPASTGADIDWDWLSRRNIVQKTIVRSHAEGARGELNFVVSVARGDNRPFNFCTRLYDKVNKDRFRPTFTLSDFQRALFAIWDDVLVPYAAAFTTESGNPTVFNIGRNDAEGAVLQMNFDALQWHSIREDESIFRCSACGRITSYSIGGVCPLRDCTGTLERLTGKQLDGEPFSPVRHYRRLIREQTVRPLRVEEHTAQVAAAKRQAIEQDFRRRDADGVDVVCGSTTFELGIDLGTIHAVFMSNLPPRVSNYRQRAGRAGRRAGMVPFILSYVRQRPHDQYFWTRLKEFIAGPVPVPHLSLTSQEVIARHANALFTRNLLSEYMRRSNERMPLEGPPAAKFVSETLTSQAIEQIERSLTDANHPLRREFELGFGTMQGSDRPVAAAHKFRERLVGLQNTYLSLRADDGTIAVLSDYGILPSYAFPLYVDELRLNRCPAHNPPRSALKLQRDRRIALQEYMPGKVIVAGKSPIKSEGVWGGYSERSFRVCTNKDCVLMDFSQNAPLTCPDCKQTRTTLLALIPRGGFFGKTIESIAEQDLELARERGETYFDPANEPPPNYAPHGNAIEIATVGASVMEQSPHRPRMRQFNPRPHSDLVLELAPSYETDLALPNLPAVRCLRRADQKSTNAQRVYLMHEFTTDIIRLRVLNNDAGQLLATSTAFVETLKSNPDRTRQRFYWDCLRRTLGEALVMGASRLLDIDTSELGITFHPADVLGNRELILFDTAPGGAGYVRQIAEQIERVFRRAEEILCSCRCGDSCYSCLRTYHNQSFHKRLNRQFVLEGLKQFNQRNWSHKSASAA